LTDGEIDVLGQSVAGLAARLQASGVALALENSKQPVERLVALIGAALGSEPYDIPTPQICWDPHNQISQSLAAEDPVRTAATLDIGMLFEFHFKQAKEGVLQRDVSDGDIDWATLVHTLRERGYHGPALFEIPAGPDIWDRLERSTRYVSGLL
jgi:sugar phosphate isomerase/epimerase